MTINVHSLLHICENVKSLGPLWSHSCFPFENMNGYLKSLFHGSQQIDKQVSILIVYVCVYCNFWAAKDGPYIIFTLTGSVHNIRNDVYIYIYIYIYMSTTWRTFRR